MRFLAYIVCAPVAFHVVKSVGLQVATGFGAQYSPYCPTSHALQVSVSIACTGFVAGGVAFTFPGGVSTRLLSRLFWAH